MIVGMSKPRALPVPFGQTVFTVADALRAGIGKERLRRTDLVVPVHGVRAPAGAEVGQVEALSVVLRDGQRFSHTTAAGIWGAPLPRGAGIDDVVHVSSDGTVAMRRRGVVGHRLPTSEVRDTPLGRASSPARSWFECADILSAVDLVVLGDHMVRRDRALATLDDLAASIVPGARGVRTARAALERIRAGAESAMETRLRLGVVDAGFPEPELNVDVLDSDGTFLGRVDMAWPEYRIALEYDGDHHRDQDTWRRDQRRSNGFTVNGWLVVHATAVDVARPAVLFERLRGAFADRAGRTRRARSVS
ncbi:hypothetical protein DEU32_102392 [Curtobacterium sp. AG1037]|nr:hypothetical protein DEU32_102392 [Curtobacterium sp. AG1037]